MEGIWLQERNLVLYGKTSVRAKHNFIQCWAKQAAPLIVAEFAKVNSLDM